MLGEWCYDEEDRKGVIKKQVVTGRYGWVDVHGGGAAPGWRAVLTENWLDVQWGWMWATRTFFRRHPSYEGARAYLLICVSFLTPPLTSLCKALSSLHLWQLLIVNRNNKHLKSLTYTQTRFYPSPCVERVDVIASMTRRQLAKYDLFRNPWFCVVELRWYGSRESLLGPSSMY